jgi:4-hydroxy-tetrahydrodipicolinate synthase
MATAKDARAWARSTLRGIGNSLCTPFRGADGDDIDWDAYRTLVRYCVGELHHPMLWCTSGVGATRIRRRLTPGRMRKALPICVQYAHTASLGGLRRTDG